MKPVADAAYALGALAIIIGAIASYGWVRVVAAVIGVLALSALWLHATGRRGNGG